MLRDRLLRALRDLLPGSGDPGAEGAGANRLRWWICFSGALHLVLILTLLAAPTSTARRDSPVPAYSVDLVAASLPPPAPPPPARKPAPRQAKPAPAEPLPPLDEDPQDEALLEPPAPDPPATVKAPPKPPPAPKKTVKVKEPPKPKAKKPPKRKVKKAPPASKAKKAVKKAVKKTPRKAVKKAPRKPKKKAVKKVVKQKKPVRKPAAKQVRKKPAPPKPKRGAARHSQLVKRLKDRRMDAAVATAIRRAEMQRQTRVTRRRPGAAGRDNGDIVKGMEFLLYRNEMLDRIKEHWTWIDKRKDLEVTVGFGVAVNGEVFGLKLLKLSGDRSYDESVVQAVRRASPLRPPPPNYAREFADVEVTFRPLDLSG